METKALNGELCLVCFKKTDLQLHHVFYGTANRRKSDKYGMVVWLCKECHTGDEGVHHNKDLDNEVKKWAQGQFEQHDSREHFVWIFGKSWL